MANIFGWEVGTIDSGRNDRRICSRTQPHHKKMLQVLRMKQTRHLKNKLAFFDDINVLSSESASGAGGTSTGGGTGATPGVVSDDKSKKEMTKFEKDMLDFLDNQKSNRANNRRHLKGFGMRA